MLLSSSRSAKASPRAKARTTAGSTPGGATTPAPTTTTMELEDPTASRGRVPATLWEARAGGLGLLGESLLIEFCHFC